MNEKAKRKRAWSKPELKCHGHFSKIVQVGGKMNCGDPMFKVVAPGLYAKLCHS